MTSKMNLLMQKKLEALPPEVVTLDSYLTSILQEGFSLVDGVFILTCFTIRTRDNPFSVEHFVDKTGYECFVNDFFVEGDRALSLSILFADTLLEQFEFSGGGGRLRVLISTDPNLDLVSIRCHLIREGESWLAEDLESYKLNAILVKECPP